MGVYDTGMAVLQEIKHLLGKSSVIRRLYFLANIKIRGSPYPNSGESELTAAVWRTVEDGDVFWDVGAMKGFYSRLVSEACQPAGIAAFEPNPQFYAECARNIDGLSGTFRRRAFQVALSDADGDVDFAIEMPQEAHSSSGSIINAHQYEDYDQVESVSVPMQTGDQIIEEYPEFDPTVIKIDVEGAEYAVLKGLEEALSRGNIRTLFIEIHLPNSGLSPSIDDFGASPEDVYSLLAEYGYNVDLVAQRSERDKHIKATRR